VGKNEVVFEPAWAQSDLIKRRKLSPVALTRACLDQIESSDSALRAWISVDGDRAMHLAEVAEREIKGGRWRGPLHGLPFGVKDQMHAVGFATTLGTRVLDPEEMAPPCTATVIERLETAGATLLGKQNLHEFGKGGTINFPYGQPRNPWNTDYNASSTSSGSGIATAAGHCSFSIGEDTGGSIRGPSSVNGVCGIRPTFGRVSRHGAVMAAYTSDTIGPMARSVKDLAMVLRAIAGHDPRDPLSAREPVPVFDEELDHISPDLKGVKVGVVEEIANPSVHPEVLASFEAAIRTLESLGAIVQRVSLPLAKWAVPLQMLTADCDVAAWFKGTYLKDRYARFDIGTRTRLVASSLIPASIYSRAMRARRIVRRQLLEAFEQVDVLITPTNVTPPKKIEDAQERVGDEADMVPRLIQRRISLYPFSLSNVPAMSVPMGFSKNGLPLALQIAARPFGESMVFRVGQAFQSVTDWHRQHPSIRGL
jgi:Asp-tRNA(Asn)/Glu-tRNA(Gln) amidotransferase A subunit family amidase